MLDEESWYSVTPEPIARYIASMCKGCVVLDGFCGAGGNTVQFGFESKYIYAVDISPEKIKITKNNYKVYHKDFSNIEFINKSFLDLKPGDFDKTRYSIYQLTMGRSGLLQITSL